MGGAFLETEGPGLVVEDLGRFHSEGALLPLGGPEEALRLGGALGCAGLVLCRPDALLGRLCLEVLGVGWFWGAGLEKALC